MRLPSLKAPTLSKSTRHAAEAALLLATLGLGACGDDPFDIEFVENPDTALLFSLDRPELNLPAGFNFQDRRPVVIETPGSTGQWDVALDTRNGELVFVLPETLGIPSRARLAMLPGMSFGEVMEAPRDTAAYNAEEPLPVREDAVYVIQTDTRRCNAFQSGVFYGKLEPLEVDAAAGTVQFVFDVHRVCNDRSLAPDG